jgi:hypothetical protein
MAGVSSGEAEGLLGALTPGEGGIVHDEDRIFYHASLPDIKPHLNAEQALPPFEEAGPRRRRILNPFSIPITS